MIRKRYTFYFIEFILGHYYPNDNKRLMFLFNRISADEKMEIESLDFSRMWYKVWLVDFSNPMTARDPNSREYTSFIKCRNKFEKTFLQDKGKRLKTLLSNTTNQDSMWEIPKGRKSNPQETDINCAIRETQEEVCIDTSQYTILSEIDPFTIQYSNEKAKYIHKYFVCIGGNIQNDNKYRSPKSAVNYLDKRQVSEVIEIKWMSLDEIKFVDYTHRFANLAERVFKLLVKRYKLPKNTKLGLI